MLRQVSLRFFELDELGFGGRRPAPPRASLAVSPCFWRNSRMRLGNGARMRSPGSRNVLVMAPSVAAPRQQRRITVSLSRHLMAKQAGKNGGFGAWSKPLSGFHIMKLERAARQNMLDIGLTMPPNFAII